MPAEKTFRGKETYSSNFMINDEFKKKLVGLVDIVIDRISLRKGVLKIYQIFLAIFSKTK